MSWSSTLRNRSPKLRRPTPLESTGAIRRNVSSLAHKGLRGVTQALALDGLPITSDQGSLLRAGPTLDLPLSYQGLCPRWEVLREHEGHRAAGFV